MSHDEPTLKYWKSDTTSQVGYGIVASLPSGYSEITYEQFTAAVDAVDAATDAHVEAAKAAAEARRGLNKMAVTNGLSAAGVPPEAAALIAGLFDNVDVNLGDDEDDDGLIDVDIDVNLPGLKKGKK